MNLLEVDDVFSGYGANEVLHGVSMNINEKEIVTVIGPNGAGKSTLLKTIMGHLIPSKGEIRFKRKNITNFKPEKKVREGIGYVPQLDNIFPSLSVQENLEMGGYILSKKQIDRVLASVFELFPALKSRKNQKAGTLSGGEKEMLAIAEALMTDPRLLMLDEPSAGLAPGISASVFSRINDICQLGTAIIIVEQNAHRSLEISDRGYVLALGEKVFEDKADKILSNEELRRAYLGG